jgi:hypothetical protein
MEKDGVIVMVTMLFTYFLVIICLYKIKNSKNNSVSVEHGSGISYQLTEIKQENPPENRRENEYFSVIRDIPNIVNP